ncbi:MAG: hypothetical protein [Bacteriophage sp.]|nr:MAG: hypothetical protein [Bacteriophage sp.]
MKLIAIYPILYRSHQYEVGEELPADDPEMVQAWLDAKTAVWQEDQTKAKARPVTAEAGLAGQSPNGETSDNVVGRVPKTPARNAGRRKKE